MLGAMTCPSGSFEFPRFFKCRSIVSAVEVLLISREIGLQFGLCRARSRDCCQNQREQRNGGQSQAFGSSHDFLACPPQHPDGYPVFGMRLCRAQGEFPHELVVQMSERDTFNSSSGGEPFLRADLSDILDGKCRYTGISQPVEKIGFL